MLSDIAALPRLDTFIAAHEDSYFGDDLAILALYAIMPLYLPSFACTSRLATPVDII